MADFGLKLGKSGPHTPTLLIWEYPALGVLTKFLLNNSSKAARKAKVLLVNRLRLFYLFLIRKKKQ